MPPSFKPKGGNTDSLFHRLSLSPSKRKKERKDHDHDNLSSKDHPSFGIHGPDGWIDGPDQVQVLVGTNVAITVGN